MRRPPPVRFDDSAAAKWRRLIEAARAQAATSETLSGLGGAAGKAAKAGTIPGQHFKGSDALQLCQLGQTYAGLHADQRPDARRRLADLADAVARALTMALSPPPQRLRKDIEG
jgi:hypothetical protein